MTENMPNHAAPVEPETKPRLVWVPPVLQKLETNETEVITTVILGS